MVVEKNYWSICSLFYYRLLQRKYIVFPAHPGGDAGGLGDRVHGAHWTRIPVRRGKRSRRAHEADPDRIALADFCWSMHDFFGRLASGLL